MSRNKHSRILLPDLELPRPARPRHPAVGPLVCIFALVAFFATFREIYILFLNSLASSGTLTKPFSLQHCFSNNLVPEPANIVESVVARYKCFATEFSNSGALVWLIVSSLLACLLLRLDELSRQELAQAPKVKQKKRKAHTTSTSFSIPKRRKMVVRDMSQESLTFLLSPIKELNEVDSNTDTDIGFPLTTATGPSTSDHTAEAGHVDCSGYSSPQLMEFRGQTNDGSSLFEIVDPSEDSELVIVFKNTEL